jgi:DtxR family Mn-dependent transcriptional regulator
MPDDTAAKVSRLPDPGNTSESEEMYLITVARAAEDGQVGLIPIAVLAKYLHVSVASANEMVRKLANRNLLTYEPYRGVQLTPEGVAVADRVLRTRRLWSTFLAEHLGLSPKEADDQACLLEHVTMPDATDRLSSFLGDPATGPLGRPIPHAGAAPPVATVRVTDLGIGDSGEVVTVRGPKSTRAFLSAEGVIPGARISVEAVGQVGILLGIGSGTIHIDRDLAATIELLPRA